MTLRQQVAQLVLLLGAKYYDQIFNTINHFAHATFMRFLISALPISLRQNQILPVNLVSVAQAIKKLKSSSFDCDGISADHLNVDCPALVQHLQLLFQMCVCTSFVPESFCAEQLLRS